MTWETVIGLEIHVQLRTRSKMFCGCSTAFGDPPNTNVCPVCLGLPGALPAVNGRAVELATRAALMLGCRIHPESVFARKNYFYPDLPKGYQISQFDRPLATGGTVEFESADRGTVRVAIERLHLEEDAGKSLHDRVPGRTAVDFNRSGVPLAEIVSGPDLRSPAEARAYLTVMRQLIMYSGASTCSMEEGSLRVDANLSVRRAGESRLGTKTEVKNMNSFANVERALEAERERQVALLESGRPVRQVTLLFDAASGSVHPTRSKEESHDYRYFPDPDLPPLVLLPEWIERQRAALPEMPAARRARLEAGGVSAYHAGVITSEPPLADYFDALVRDGVPARVAGNWVTGEVMTAYNETRAFPVSASRLADVIGLEREGVLSLQAAKRVFAAMRETDEPARDVAERLGLVQVREEGALSEWIDGVLAAHPEEVERFRAGETKLIGFFVGQVMKQSGGKADPKGIQPLLKERLK
ncbi:MAG TPA: Asp-tRNA(Asn)/Glu-tRNA(Gln) amidotransferase subunit GatB [Gemmatimonadales bacterium]